MRKSLLALFPVGFAMAMCFVANGSWANSNSASATNDEAAAQSATSRAVRVGNQTAISTHLIDELPHAVIESPHLASDHPIVSESTRIYRNPWASGRHAALNVRTVWPLGGADKWVMRSAVTLPVNSTTTWPVHFQPGSLLTFDMAIGSWTTPFETVQLRLEARGEGEWSTVWSSQQIASPLYRLAAWNNIRVDLSELSGPGFLRLIATSRSGGNEYKAVILLAEPVIQVPSTTVGIRKTSVPRHAENMLVVLVDGLRSDTCGTRRIKTYQTPPLPSLEALLQKGTSFSNTFSTTNLSRAGTLSVLSSQTPQFGGFHNVKWIYPKAVKRDFYRANTALLTTALRGQGYRTAAFGHNRYLIGNIKRSLDIDFDTVIDYRTDRTPDESWIVTTATNWIRAHQDERWFAMVHLYAPPEPPEWRPSRTTKDTADGLFNHPQSYIQGLQRSDGHIKRILEELDSLDLTSKTLVVVTGTHGRILNPAHDCWSYNTETACLDRSGHTLYDEEVHVPLVFSQPGRIEGGGLVHSAVSHLDIAPTLLGLAGLPPVAGQLGRNLSKTILGQNDPRSTPILLEGRRASAIRWRGFKFIHHQRREVLEFNRSTLFNRAISRDEIYDLVRDPWELDNLALRPEQHYMLPIFRALSHATRSQLSKRKSQPPRTGHFNIDLSSAPLLTPAPNRPRPRTDKHTLPSRQEWESGVRRRGPETTQNPRWHHLIFHRGNSQGQFRGTIRCRGAIEAIELLGNPEQNRTARDGSGNIRVSTSVTGSEVVGIRFKTNADQYSLEFNLVLDQQPIQADRFFVGTYGVKLYSDPLIIQTKDQRDLALSPPGGPHRRNGSVGGVFYWTETSGR